MAGESRYVSREQFIEGIQQVLPRRADAIRRLSELLFQRWNPIGDGRLTFDEFLIAIRQLEVILSRQVTFCSHPKIIFALHSHNQRVKKSFIWELFSSMVVRLPNTRAEALNTSAFDLVEADSEEINWTLEQFDRFQRLNWDALCSEQPPYPPLSEEI
jgi:hypothetical protein